MFLEYCLVRINSLISVVGDGSGFIFIIIEEKLSDFCQVVSYFGLLCFVLLGNLEIGDVERVRLILRIFDFFLQKYVYFNFLSF